MATTCRMRKTRWRCAFSTARIRARLISILPSAALFRELRIRSTYSNANAVLKLTTLVTNSLVNEARGSFQRLFAQATDNLPAGLDAAEPRHHADCAQPDAGAGSLFPDQWLRRRRVSGAPVQPDQSVPGGGPGLMVARKAHCSRRVSRWKRLNGTSISAAWSAGGCLLEASPTCWPQITPAISSSASSAYPAALLQLEASSTHIARRI